MDGGVSSVAALQSCRRRLAGLATAVFSCRRTPGRHHRSQPEVWPATAGVVGNRTSLDTVGYAVSPSAANPRAVPREHRAHTSQVAYGRRSSSGCARCRICSKRQHRCIHSSRTRVKTHFSASNPITAATIPARTERSALRSISLLSLFQDHVGRYGDILPISKARLPSSPLPGIEGNACFDPRPTEHIDDDLVSAVRENRETPRRAATDKARNS